MHIPWTCPLTMYLNSSLRVTFLLRGFAFGIGFSPSTSNTSIRTFVCLYAGVFVRTSTAGPVKKLIAVSLSVEFIGKYNSFAFTRSVTSARNFNAPKGETRRTNEPVLRHVLLQGLERFQRKHQVLSFEYLLIYLSYSFMEMLKHTTIVNVKVKLSWKFSWTYPVSNRKTSFYLGS